jgi:hypothetical protein
MNRRSLDEWTDGSHDREDETERADDCRAGRQIELE